MVARSRSLAGTKTVDDYADDWEHNARSDAHFAILSDSAHNERSWELDGDQFMASGELEIARMVEFLAAAGIQPRFEGRALDFGCGLGRLTQALGRRFAAVVGVDISQSMIDRARSVQTPAGVSFVVNRSSDLGCFDDSSFDFIYSNLVLQHVSNDLQRSYLVEFCRILTPGGLAVIQVPSLRRGLKGTVLAMLPPQLVAPVRRHMRPSALLRRDDHVLHMEMNCLPESDVWGIVEGAGCVVAHVSILAHALGRHQAGGGPTSGRHRVGIGPVQHPHCGPREVSPLARRGSTRSGARWGIRPGRGA